MDLLSFFLTTMNVCGTDEKHFSFVGSIVVTVVFFSTGFLLLQECGVGFSYAVRNFSEVSFPPLDSSSISLLFCS